MPLEPTNAESVEVWLSGFVFEDSGVSVVTLWFTDQSSIFLVSIFFLSNSKFDSFMTRLAGLENSFRPIYSRLRSLFPRFCIFNHYIPLEFICWSLCFRDALNVTMKWNPLGSNTIYFFQKLCIMNEINHKCTIFTCFLLIKLPTVGKPS